MADQYYTVPDNPQYNENIRRIQNSDPVNADAVVNPVIEALMQNTAAVKKKADSAGKLAESKTVDGVAVDGSKAVTHYGTCGTAASTVAKTVTLPDFSLVEGAVVRVKFTYANSASSPTINVNGTGAKSIVKYGTTASMAYMWQAGELVEFAYDGTRWVMLEGGIASTTYYGRTRLNSNVDSSRTTEAATPSAVKQAYELAQQAMDAAGESKEPAAHKHVKADITDFPSSMTPISHAAAAATYGTGSASNYGHVRLSDSTDSDSGASGGVAATPAAVNKVNTLAAAVNTAIYASNLAIGHNANASGNESTALGHSANAAGEYSTALGRGANANGTDSTALGHSANADGVRSTALGHGANAIGHQSTALGMGASAVGGSSAALGYNANAAGEYSAALGHSAKAAGEYSTALGRGANASGDYSTAIGYKAATSNTNSMQLGDASGLSSITARVGITETSDARDKADISQVEDGALEFLRKIKAVRYVWNGRGMYIDEDNLSVEDRKKKAKYGLCGYDRDAHAKGTKKGSRIRVGLLAQDIQTALREVYGDASYANLVNDNLYDFDPKTIPEDVESQLGVNYGRFVPFLIKAIQELAARMKILEGV